MLSISLFSRIFPPWATINVPDRETEYIEDIHRLQPPCAFDIM